MAAPTMTNSMHSGPPGAVSQAWIEQSRSSVGVKTEPQATTAPPKVGELMGTVNRAGMSSAVNALLNKSAAEKRAGIADAGEVKVSSGPLFERAESNFSRVSSFGRTPSLREAVKRAQEADKLKKEQELVKTTVTNVRVSIKYIKHLPKMDKFGKTDSYCITVVDNKKFGGKKYKRKSKIVKKNLNPEFPHEEYDFAIKNYPEQQVVITVMDWDVGDDDDLIGDVKVPLEPLLEQKRFEHTYNVLGLNGQPVTGHDGSHTLIRVILERDVEPADVGPDGVNIQSLVGDSEEIRTLATPNWESSVRGLMFDIENHSNYPVVITGFEAQAGRGKGEGSATYTIYHTVGKWNVQRCPCCRIAPCKFMKCCCGSCPSGKADFGCMKCCCRCTPCSKGGAGCCCCGECGPGLELAEPCCEGCIPCCTGNFALPIFLFPALVPLCCWGLGCCVSEYHGGVSTPGCPAISICRLCGCQCCRNGVHRHLNDCTCGPETPKGPVCSCNCSCCSTFCHCCRKKFYDRRRWTWVASGWLKLPSDWGDFEHLPSLQHYGHWQEWRDDEWVKSGGGIMIPPKQTSAVYIHCPHPATHNANHALAVRGPFKRGFERGDITDKDAFIRLRTGAMTNHTVPFANSDIVDSSRDGQFWRLRDQQLDEYKVYAFAGKIHYRVLDPKSTPCDCAWLCGSRYCCHLCC